MLGSDLERHDSSRTVFLHERKISLAKSHILVNTFAQKEIFANLSRKVKTFVIFVTFFRNRPCRINTNHAVPEILEFPD